MTDGLTNQMGGTGTHSEKVGERRGERVTKNTTTHTQNYKQYYGHITCSPRTTSETLFDQVSSLGYMYLPTKRS